MAVAENPGEDLRAALAARQELGPDFEPAIIESFLDRLERTIDARVDARVAERLAKSPTPKEEKKGGAAEYIFASMFGGVLASGVIGLTVDDAVPVVALVWIVVAVINIVHAVAGRPRS
ncbi:MAG TPA: hypothetical protein VE465_28965 [Streptosporangiaceae bacterium]|jgi:CRP-like cAMP-binding protein|nr:hypothetical protein [Streptosporangiaceae bacterium]